VKLLCIDHGLKRLGVAICDPSGTIARELAIIQRTSNTEDFAKLHKIITDHQPQGVVVGLPHNPEKEEQVQADQVRVWVARFSATITLPFVYWDEQLTSQDARELSIRLKRKPRDPIDDLAARVILQSYLDAVKDGLAELPSVNKDS
jgi:putative holliday junction resolvase